MSLLQKRINYSDIPLSVSGSLENLTGSEYFTLTGFPL